MSLPLIADTATEVHRLAIAGSALAAGDFRLNKLVPQLEAIGAKAPIFTRIAQGVKAVTEEPDAAKAGRALLDLSTLLTAIQYTQSPHGADGEFTPITTGVNSWTPTVAGYRSLAAVVEALTSTGEGRLEIVKDACERGLFKDLRLMQPAIGALSDRFGELADHVAEHAIPQFGPVVIPLLKAGFDPKGGNAHARRLHALCAVDKEEGRAFARAALEEARKEVKVAAIAGLAGSDADYDTILSYTKDRAAEVRHAAIRAISRTSNKGSAAYLQSLFDGPEGEVAIAAAASSSDSLPENVFEYTKGLLDQKFHAKKEKEQQERKLRMLAAVLDKCHRRTDTLTLSLLALCFAQRKELDWELNTAVAQLMYELDSPEHDLLLCNMPEELGDGQHVIAFMAAHRRVSHAELFRLFGSLFEKKGEDTDLFRLLRGWPIQLPFGDEWPCWGENIELDPSWIKLAVKMEVIPVVANLARRGDKDARELLVKKEITCRDDALQYEIRCAIFRADPDNALQYIGSCLHAFQKRKAPHEITFLLRHLTAATIPVDVKSLTEIGQELSGKYKEVFEESLAEFRLNAVGT